MNFWQRIKKINYEKSQVDIEMQTLVNHYNSIFNESITSVESDSTKYEEEVTRYFNQSSGCKEKLIISENQKSNILTKLKRNKSPGINTIENECFKNHNQAMLTAIKHIINIKS
jgi:hypothetical protein